jgi:phage terminase large subunit-like protein
MGLTPQQLEELAYDWRFWGREDQLEPPPIGPSGTPWLTWLILAGRGFGKTRTGAETIRKWATGKTPLAPGQCSRIAIVAETSADARDVLVEGESGILSCHPKDFRPRYEPSKRRLTWPNGAVATTYNATEPDQLRGPQHDAGWCLVDDTAVLMGDGTERRLDSINTGEFVMTRAGPRRVIASGLTRRNAALVHLRTVDGRAISGTPDHPVWIDGRGFMPMADVLPGMTACVTPVSNTLAASGIDKKTDTGKQPSAFTDLCGSAKGDRSLRDTTSTIETKTKGTIRSRISSFLRTATTARCMWRKNSAHSARLPSSGLRQRIGETARSVWSGLSNALHATVNLEAAPSFLLGSALRPAPIRQGPEHFAGRSASVPFAGTSTLPKSARSYIAQGFAIIGRLPNARLASLERLCVGHAVAHSEALDLTRHSAGAGAPLHSTVEILSVERLANRRDVYDIAVDGEREFFANGILVHNCDELAKWAYAEDTWDQLQFGMRLGDRPRKIITTTPRPIPALKRILALPTTVVTKGSTFDNIANLADSFITEITARYQGTRLGRQELDAELLDDTPGALWTRQLIEQANQLRVDMRGIVPALQRVVVAIDPSGARDISDENADSQGIVIAGKGVDGRAYVLSDWTCKLSPHGWGSRAVQAYRHFAADRVVAERNFGGAMVEHTVRTVDSRIPYREVNASRGKIVRAEPVAALYEQGRVVHLGDPTLDKPGVGTGLESLEDQMCQLTHHGFMGEGSPDRVDALVWALTDLMLEAERPRLAFG